MNIYVIINIPIVIIEIHTAIKVGTNDFILICIIIVLMCQIIIVLIYGSKYRNITFAGKKCSGVAIIYSSRNNINKIKHRINFLFRGKIYLHFHRFLSVLTCMTYQTYSFLHLFLSLHGHIVFALTQKNL